VWTGFQFAQTAYIRLFRWKSEAVSYYLKADDSLFRSYASFVTAVWALPSVGVLGIFFTCVTFFLPRIGLLDTGLFLGAPFFFVLMLWWFSGSDRVLEWAFGIQGHYRTRLGLGPLHRCSSCGNMLAFSSSFIQEDEFGRAIGFVCHCSNVDRLATELAQA